LVLAEICMKLTEEQIRELAGIFDDIITSDSDAVKSAFHRLAFLSSLAQQTKEEPGPFTDLVVKLDWMKREMTEMKRDIQILQNSGQSDMFADFADSDNTSDITLNLSGIMAGPLSVIGSGSMIDRGGYMSIQPLTSNDIVSLSTVDLSTIKITNGTT
jgi:hypothetical protein